MKKSLEWRNINTMNTQILGLLKIAVANKASDIHLMESSIPKLRVNGELIEATNYPMESPEVNREMIMSLMSEEQKNKFIESKDLDFSVTIEGARFRVNMFWQRGEIQCSLRVVPSEIPGFADLNLPSMLKTFCDLKQGFVLITGPTGQGKSTTVASILNEINSSRALHLVTIEDPVEYVIKPIKSIVSQREVGYDTVSFSKALRACLRQDPNVVFVGEMRDLETIQSAITIAETGHLVFSTLHTNSASQTIDRIVDVFPEGAKEQIRVQLASVITAVVSQRLVPTVDGKRVPAFEILTATSAVKNSIREGKSFMIDNIIQTSADVGMVTLEASLGQLVLKGLITEEVAMNYSLRPADLQSKLRSLKNV